MSKRLLKSSLQKVHLTFDSFRWGLQEWRPSHCKQKAGFTTWWNWISTSLWGLMTWTPGSLRIGGWCNCQGTLHEIWKLTVIRQSPQWQEKWNTSPISEKGRKEDGELQTSEPYLCVWEDDGIDDSFFMEGMLRHTQNKDMTWDSQAFHQWQIIPDQSGCLVWRNDYNS